MAVHPMYTLDVFAEERYAGNQLAVFRNAADISTETMQRIAREMNYSETTFILSDEPRDGGYDVRIFTPAEEIPFAGHPVLGTAYIIQKEIQAGRSGTVRLNLRAGQIPVKTDVDDTSVLWMEPLPPELGRTFQPGEAAAISGLKVSDIDERYPVQMVSTGRPFVIVPVKANGSLAKAGRNLELLTEFYNRHGAKLYLFSPEPVEAGHDLRCRMFTTIPGIPEDPATGSAAGCLAGYLARYRYFGSPSIDLRVEQGYEIGRASLLRLRASDKGGHISAVVGGRVIPVVRGEL